MFFARHSLNQIKSSIFKAEVIPDNPTQAQIYLSTLPRLTTAFMEKHKNLVILQADKGGKNVIMDRREYIQKATEHIQANVAAGNYAAIVDMNESEIRNRVECDYMSIISMMNPFLIHDGVIREPLKAESYSLPLFSGAPKIHKAGIPLRPIIASCDMIGETLSSWILKKLYIIACHLGKFSIGSAVPVVTDLKIFHTESDHVLDSLDYESMYTNVNVDSTISIIEAHYHLIQGTTSVPCQVFIRCLRFFTNDAAYFGAIGKLFAQVSGLAMGNRLAQVLAAIRTDHALLDTLKDIDASIMSFLYKYVDDIFSSIHRDHISLICDSLSRNTGMNITIEYENESDEIVFLDCIFKREQDNTITYRWYSKECSAHQTLNYHSHHPWHVRRNCITNLIQTAAIRTTERFMPLTISKITEVASNCSYPDGVVQGLFRQFFDTDQHHQPRAPRSAMQDQKPTRFVSCPMYEPIASRIETITRSLNIPAKVVRRPMAKNRKVTFSKLKDRTPTMMKKNCLFRMRCTHCDFTCQLTSLSRNIQRTISDAMKIPSSALRTHIIKNPHHAFDDAIQVVHTFYNVRQARISLECQDDIKKLTTG